MSEALYRQIMSVCSEDELKGIVMPLSAACSKLITGQMADEVGSFYAYDLFDACPEDNPKPFMPQYLAGNKRKLRSQNRPVLPSSGDGDTGLGAPCLGSSMDIYFNLTVVKNALG